jgi:hypothetical protein
MDSHADRPDVAGHGLQETQPLSVTLGTCFDRLDASRLVARGKP